MAQRLLMDRGWRFHLGDVPAPPVITHGETYFAAKAGRALGAASPLHDFAAWEQVDLPHDWQMALDYDPAANVSQGFRPRHVAWYSRRFAVDTAAAGDCLALDFEGVGRHCTVWVNGHLLARNFCGYTPFRVDFSDVARFGSRLNTVVVRVDGTPIEGWWYEGAGIYRHVYLVRAPRLHLARYGTFVVSRPGTPWTTAVTTEVENAGLAAAGFEVAWTLLDPDGAAVATATAAGEAAPGETVTVAADVAVAAPRLWDVDAPNLYSVRVELRRAGSVVDTDEVTFGYRTCRFDADEGFLLNGRRVPLRGTCNHQDHAGVGVAVPDAVHEWRIRQLLAMGSNAYRCAHNPPAPELLDACDRLGMLVLDENRHFSTAPDVLAQLRTLVRRDRNHPSVVFWSIFNEEPEQGTPVGRRLAETMIREIRRLDPTRPVTAALNSGIFTPDGVDDVLDVVGINYQLGSVDRYREEHPERPLVGSENNCAFATRGEYAADPAAQVFDNYDSEAAGWGDTVRATLDFVAARPWFAGQFTWTGFDYRGEPSPYQWPSINSHWGIMDVCGFPKGVYYLYQAAWSARPVLHLLPHWNHAPGAIVRVMAYTNCDRVELFLNGRSLGVRDAAVTAPPEWSVPFEPGELRAVGNGIECVVATTGPAVALELLADRDTLAADGEDSLPVTVRGVDAAGRVVPTADQRVTFAIAGGRLLGVGNGDPNCHEPDKALSRSLFHGLAQAIVQAGDAPGQLRLTATADGLAPAELVLPLTSVAVRPAVPAPRDAIEVTGWRRSPRLGSCPGADDLPAETDMNTWESVEPGHLPAMGPGAGYVIFHAAVIGIGESLVFDGLKGVGDVYVGGEHVIRKRDDDDRRVDAELHSGPADIVVVVALAAGDEGLTAPVRVW